MLLLIANYLNKNSAASDGAYHAQDDKPLQLAKGGAVALVA